MTDAEMQELLAQLASQAARLDELQARLATHDRHRRVRAMRRFPILLVVLLVALTPLALLAASPFNDLNPGSVHNDNIGLIYDAGITKGCDPNVSYCPNGLVTREEMASFLARTAGLGSNPPVVNAKTAQTAVNATHATTADNATNATNAANATHATSADTATTATSATNADQLGSQPASNYVRSDFSTRIRYAPYSAVRLTSTLTLTFQAGPATLIGTSTTTGTQSVAIPLPVPAPLFGLDLDVILLRYCYKVSNSATRIDAVQLVRGDDGAATVIKVDNTDQNSTATECVDVAISPAVRIIDALYAQFDLVFANTSHTVTLYAVQLLVIRHTP